MDEEVREYRCGLCNMPYPELTMFGEVCAKCRGKNRFQVSGTSIIDTSDGKSYDYDEKHWGELITQFCRKMNESPERQSRYLQACLSLEKWKHEDLEDWQQQGAIEADPLASEKATAELAKSRLEVRGDTLYDNVTGHSAPIITLEDGSTWAPVESPRFELSGTTIIDNQTAKVARFTTGDAHESAEYWHKVLTSCGDKAALMLKWEDPSASVPQNPKQPRFEVRGSTVYDKDTGKLAVFTVAGASDDWCVRLNANPSDADALEWTDHAPQKMIVPWTHATFPKGMVWIRDIVADGKETHSFLIVGVDDEPRISFEGLANYCVWSSEAYGDVWCPCGMEVES